MTVRSGGRVRVRVEGTVQGVGFRPFVYRLASELELSGWVLNDSRGVLLEAEGAPAALEALLSRLRDEAPPLAVVERITPEVVEPSGETDFRIVESEEGGEPLAAISADVATCEDCLAELRNPASHLDRDVAPAPLALPSPSMLDSDLGGHYETGTF